MIVYNKNTGEMYNRLPDEVNIKTFYEDYPKQFKDNLDFLMNRDIPTHFLQIPSYELRHYKIIDNEFIRRPECEIKEIREYGRILTEEERLLNQLKPPTEEVKKAENTIEILTLIQEVM